MPSTSNARRGSRKAVVSKQKKSASYINEHRRHQSLDFPSSTSRSVRSASTVSSSGSSGSLRLAEVAKQLGLGVHVENWREDTKLVQQHLPMQHIIGSLKRDRDDPTSFKTFDDITAWNGMKFPIKAGTSALSPMSDDSFLQMLHSPKRRKFSSSSKADSLYTTGYDPDRRFSHHSPEHIPKEISQAALPGLNHILNLSTITAEERDIFTEYAPKDLEDPHVLMSEVLHLRKEMMDLENVPEDAIEFDCAESVHSDIISAERDAEVRKALEEFIDLSDTRRWIAKI